MRGSLNEIRPKQTPEEVGKLAQCLSKGTALIDTYLQTHIYTCAFAIKEVTVFFSKHIIFFFCFTPHMEPDMGLDPRTVRL